jgi:hypothetical protein
LFALFGVRSVTLVRQGFFIFDSTKLVV